MEMFGYPFNSKYHFHRGGCSADIAAEKKSVYFYSYQEDTEVIVFDEFANFAFGGSLNFYHVVMEWIPTFLDFAEILRNNPGIPVICRNWKKFVNHLGSFIIGDQINQLNIYESENNTIFLGNKVYQPSFPTCLYPNEYQWRNLRKAFASPNGFPIFNPDWTFLEPKIISGKSLQEVGNNWVAILGKRLGSRELVQSDEVEKTMIEYFGRERVKIFSGNTSLFDAKQLFNRALVFISPHGALLANMLFMPSKGFVIEFIPDFFRMDTYPRMNKICGHNYYRLQGRGNKHTALRINMESFYTVFTEMVTHMKTIHPQKVLI